MKFDHFPSRLVLSAGVAVSLGLSYVTLSAQDMPQLGAAPGAAQPASPAPAAQPSADSSAASNPIFALAQAQEATADSQSAPAPATPPSAAAPASPPAAAEPSAQAAAPTPEAPAAPRLTQAELAQLLAPIALYPDQLLGQILMASTYPVQIVEAARWVAEPAHRRLKGQALTTAASDRNWDPSVVALLPFPHVLELMSSRIEWTEKLGTAFVAEQSDVMNAVQQLRQQAVDAGNFKSGPQCRCVVERSNNYITVASANPGVIYPPVYNPVAIYGAWPYPAYPPYLFPVPVGFAFEPGFFIGFGYGVDIAFYQPWWSWWGFNWGGGNIIVNNTNFTVIAGGRGRFDGGVWTSRSNVASSVTTNRVSSSTTRVATNTTAAGSLATRSGTRGTAAGAATTSGRTAGTTSGRTVGSRTAVSGRTASSRTALTHGSRLGRTAYKGGATARATTSHRGVWGGGRGGRFGSAAPMRGSIRGGGSVHMAANGGFGHGGGFARGGGGFARGGGGAVHMAAGGGGSGKRR
ncbi:MAG TPA: DUF3300 domain-containing protein [Stellaceae bacterium]|nr:DUF3300 domain-containing protein [Stellaceae bacterium]